MAVSKRGFARVGKADQAHVGHDAQFQQKIALPARLARLGEARRLPARGGKIAVAQSAAAAFAQDELLAVLRQIGHQFPFRGAALRGFLFQVNFHGPFRAGVTDDRAAGWKLARSVAASSLVPASAAGGSAAVHAAKPACRTGTFTDQILARRAVHALAQSRLAVLGDEPGIVELGHQIVQVVVGLKNDIAAAPAVAAAGAAFGPEGFPQKGDAAFAAVSGPPIDFDFINKHERYPQQKRRG